MATFTTASASRRPDGLVRRAQLMRVLNVPMRRMLALPFATPLSKALMLLYLTGRRTGKLYRQPVSYAQAGGVLLTPGGGRWKLNLQENQAIPVHLRGRTISLRPEFVRDAHEVEGLVHKMIAVNPRAARFVPFVGPGGEIDRTGLETALEYGFAIIRWHFEAEEAAHQVIDDAADEGRPTAHN